MLRLSEKKMGREGKELHQRNRGEEEGIYKKTGKT